MIEVSVFGIEIASLDDLEMRDLSDATQDYLREDLETVADTVEVVPRGHVVGIDVVGADPSALTDREKERLAVFVHEYLQEDTDADPSSVDVEGYGA